MLKKVIKKVKNKLIPSNSLEIYSRRSFSQSGEDLILKFIFQSLKIANPSYIDIGAHHPYHISNTALFYLTGSEGINIEPNPYLFENFEKNRKRDLNLNIGVGKSNEDLNFYIMSASTLSTFSRKEALNYKNEGRYRIKEIKKVKVQNLLQILNQYNNGIFPDFLNLDAEGVDEIIIDSIDFEKSYPIVICIETISFSTKGLGVKNNNLISKIKANGYFLYADTYINSIFVNKKYWKKAFN